MNSRSGLLKVDLNDEFMTAAGLARALDSLPAPWRAKMQRWSTADARLLVERVSACSGERPIAPADPFRALRLVDPEQAKVVVFGQDPYPTKGEADGLAFSAQRSSSRPSLRRVFEVLEADRPGWRRPASGRLDAWAHQGALLLNPVLSVEVGRKESHMNAGWQALTSEIVRILCERPNPPVFMLWGNKAQEFFKLACPAGCKLRVLTARHPSNDFRRDFMADGSHFVATADLLDWWAIGSAH
jgi:uracil-DNA glycosylase